MAAMTRQSEEVEGEEQVSNPGVMWVWGVATGVGVGLGWYLAQTLGQGIVAALPIGVCQGVLLWRKRLLAALWALVTSVVGGTVLVLLTPMGGPLLVGQGLTIVNVGGPILLLTFVGVPIVAFAQFIAVVHWAGADSAIRWFGASVFSFPIVALFGWVLTTVWAPDNIAPEAIPDYLVSASIYVQPFEPRLWVIGVAWGLCTGWAMAKIPEVFGARGSEGLL